MERKYYDYQALCSSGPAIMALTKDIKEVHRPGSSNSHNDQFDDPLDENEIEWLLVQAVGYKVFALAGSFVLFMRENHDLIRCPVLACQSEDRIVRMEVEDVPESDECHELLELAQKLTPQEKKLSFRPYRYSFSIADDNFRVKELEKKKKPLVEDEDNESEQMSIWRVPELSTKIPLDFDIIVGEEGEKKKTLQANKAVLASCFPTFEFLLEEAATAQKLDLQDLEYDAVKMVLSKFTTSQKIEMPTEWDRGYKQVQMVLERFGLSKEDNQSSTNMARISADIMLKHPALSDARWLDVTFIVGPNKEEVKANRAVLASLNDVLRCILYGTGFITMDPSKPIMWPDFDVIAVQRVFLALVQCGREEVTIPLESVESAKVLVDYLDMSSTDLNLYYETPFERMFDDYNSFYFVPGEDGEGLKVQHG